MAFYRNEIAAIVCGVNAGMNPIYAIQCWQKQYKSGFVEDLTKKNTDIEVLTKEDKLLQDCITRTRIKRNATRGAFYAVVAKYATDETERVMAITELVKLCEIDASDDGKRFLIWLWSVGSKQRRGLIGQALELFNGVSQRTFFYKKKLVFDWLSHLESLAISDAKEVLAGVL